ncbi:hypothetical protein HGB07_05605 [Candidatus Roizmanbacteria bacterium]|nr:hypothetical protein [Candidatus Roizmanbacteria bacterium]
MQKLKKYITIVGVMSVSFLFVTQVLNNIYIADTPQFRPDLPQYLAGIVNRVVTSPQKLLAALFGPKSQPINETERKIVAGGFDNVLKPMSKGVYAGEIEGKKVVVVKDSEVEWVYYTLTLSSGKTISVRIPKGDSAPQAKDYEYLK